MAVVQVLEVWVFCAFKHFKEMNGTEDHIAPPKPGTNDLLGVSAEK